MTIDGESLADLAALDDNDPLRERARNLIARLMDETEKLLTTSTPAVKATLIRSTVPQLVRALREERKESDELVEMRRQLQELQAAWAQTILERQAGAEPGMDSAPASTATTPDGPPMPLGMLRPPKLEIPQSMKRGPDN